MLNENIKTIRKSKGLSQEELAVKLHVVRQTISKWEQGLSVQDADMLISISEVLETPVSTLLGENVVEREADNLNRFGVKKKYLTHRSLYCKMQKSAVVCLIFHGCAALAKPEQKRRRIGENMEKIVEQGLLYDFYGELLNAHQQEIYESVVYENLSLGEIAEAKGISRQAVHDIVKRCDKALLGYEEKLKLVARFTSIKEKIAQINRLSEQYESGELEEAASYGSQIRELSARIMQEL